MNSQNRQLKSKNFTILLKVLLKLRSFKLWNLYKFPTWLSSLLLTDFTFEGWGVVAFEGEDLSVEKDVLPGQTEMQLF